VTNGSNKVRLSAIALILAFAVQALTVTWFLSDMWHKVKSIVELKAGQRITIIERELIWYASQLNEAKDDIRELERHD
jgi:hypothetical protein